MLIWMLIWIQYVKEGGMVWRLGGEGDGVEAWGERGGGVGMALVGVGGGVVGRG